MFNFSSLQDQLHDTMLTLDRVLSLYWLAVLVVQGMKKHFSSAKLQQQELFPAAIVMMLVLNVLVSITVKHYICTPL